MTTGTTILIVCLHRVPGSAHLVDLRAAQEMASAMTTRTHISHTAAVKLRDVNPRGRCHAVGKPMGLWWGVDGEWEEWCRINQPNWITPHVFDVDVSRCRLITIATLEELLAFGKAYGTPPPWWKREEWPHLRKAGRFDLIDWTAVAAGYDGIEIAPYLWQARLDVFWYYGWDCASGVCWNASKLILTPRKEDHHDSEGSTGGAC